MSMAVIGGGLAGLAAAIDGARGGANVVLYDARAGVGGRARTRHTDGFLLNEGPHALYLDGAATAFLRELDREPDGGKPDAASGVGVLDHEVGPMPGGVWSVARTPLLRGDRVRFAALFARLGRLRPTDFAHTTVSDAVEGLVGDGPAARMVRALFRLATYGHDPDVASADVGVQQLQYSLKGGVRYVDDGWQSIVDGLVAECDDLGVQLVADTKASDLRGDGRGVSFRAGGETRRHDAVVLATGGPRRIASVLADEEEEAVHAANRWAAAARPATVASLDVGLDCEWGDDVPRFALGIDEPLYLSVHAPVARLAPPGTSLVHVSRYHHPDEDDDPLRDRARCEALLDRIRPGWQRNATHVGFHRRLAAATDQPRAVDGGMGGRPGPALPGLDRVRIAGDWVGPVGVLADASVASGRAAVRGLL